MKSEKAGLLILNNLKQHQRLLWSVYENNDFNGKTLIPFVTHQGSGLSGLDATLKTLFPKSLVKNGIAVRGEDCQNNRDNVKEQVLKWLKSIE